ncbi:MAG: adenylate kinase family protein [Candidatus Helarchaeota archaeon]
MSKIILLTGTPGTGKSILAASISNEINCKLFNINKIVVEHELFSKWDETRNIPIIDDNKINQYFLDFLNSSSNDAIILIEGHYFEFLSPDLINKIIILRTHPSILQERLQKRNYKPEKIKENVQAEILGNIMGTILEKYAQVPLFQVDTSKMSEKKASKLIIDFIKNKKNPTKGSEYIDWLPIIEEKKELEKFF